MWSSLFDYVFNTGTPNQPNSGRYRTPPSSSLNSQSFRSTNNNASSQNHSGNPKNANARKRPGISTFCVHLPEGGDIEINIKKNESGFSNMNIQSVPRNPKKFENNANLGGQNYNKSKSGSQNNRKPLNHRSAHTNTNQKTNSSNSQTCSKTKLAPKNKQPNLDVRRKTKKMNN